MWILLCAFAVSLSITLLMVHHARAGAHHLTDHDLSGPQKFHSAPVPRVGGIGIFCGAVAAAGLLFLLAPEIWRPAALLLLCSLPAFGSGVTKDLTKTQSPRRRLFFTAIAAALGVALLDATITRTDIPGLDWAVSFYPFAALLTVFAVTGVANSLNIIDGFNGLASMCAVLMLVAIGYVGLQVDDMLIVWLAVAVVGAVLGFFVCNFPLGLIFLGDGGAYFLGFMVAELAVLLMARNPGVSPMFPLLVCAYPVFETVFSIYRRVMLREQSASTPDGIHLHSLIYRRVMRWAEGRRRPRSQVHRNSMTSPYLWLLCCVAIVPAMLFWDSTALLGSFIVVFGIVYTALYWRIVRFRSPRWLHLHRLR